MRLAVLPVALLALLATACASTPSPAPAAPEPVAAAAAVPAGDVSAIARTFVERFLAGDYEAARTDFDEGMRQAVSPAKLEAASKALAQQVGAFEEILAVTPKEIGDHTHVFVACGFAKQDLALLVVFPNGSRQITGFFFDKP